MLERSFGRIKQLRENQGPIQRFAIEQANRLLKAAGVVDQEIETETPLSSQQASTIPIVEKRVEILTSSQLIEKTREELHRKFAVEISVSEPPALLLETHKVAEDEGFGFFEPLYLPRGEYREDSVYPPDWIKPESWYWEQIKTGMISTDAAIFAGTWILFDRSKRPDYKGGKQVFEDDRRLGDILANLRQEGRIDVPGFVKHTPESSRFAISPNEQDHAVFPELAKALRLQAQVIAGEAIIRTPKAMEFNLVGNLHYPYLGQANTWECYSDEFEGGNRLGGSFADITCHGYNSRYDDITFRPLVIFSSRAG